MAWLHQPVLECLVLPAMLIRLGDLRSIHVDVAVEIAVVRAAPETNGDPVVILGRHLDLALPRCRVDRPTLVQRCPAYMSVIDLGRFILTEEVSYIIHAWVHLSLIASSLTILAFSMMSFVLISCGAAAHVICISSYMTISVDIRDGMYLRLGRQASQCHLGVRLEVAHQDCVLGPQCSIRPAPGGMKRPLEMPYRRTILRR